MPADGLAPLYGRISADTVMTEAETTQGGLTSKAKINHVGVIGERELEGLEFKMTNRVHFIVHVSSYLTKMF